MQVHHWSQISEIIGALIEIRPDSSLSDMIELGLHLHIEKLEKISSAASKEYTLEKGLLKMKEEWIGVKFECKMYR